MQTIPEKQKVVTSLYRQIAIDLARSIVSGKYVQGEKLFGRSVLASHYKVSPETIRKAVYLLKDVGILESEKGSGIEIVSVEKARAFVERYNDVENIMTIKKELEGWAKDQAAQTTEMLNKVYHLITEVERVAEVGPIDPFQVKITEQCTVIGKTAAELMFWHKTGGTIVAIRRGDSLIVSPGPYASLRKDDYVYIVGDQATYAAVNKLLYE